MANNENLIPIPGRLHSVATEGHVAGADEIYDDTLQKDQATINAEVQTAIGTGGTVDQKIAAAVNALDATKSQTAGADGLALSINEENGKITSISGSIAANTYDAYGAASTAKSEVLGSGVGTDYNTLKKIEDKLSPIETAVGTGGSIDQRIEDATEDCAYLGEDDGTAVIADFDPQTDTIWKKAQTLSSADKAQVKTNLGLPQEIYSKAQVNELVSTPHQNYVTVSTYASLPATGSADTIYRVSNYDGSQSQVDATMYSEYAWNGSGYTFLCKKSQVGEVFDISAYHSNAKYNDLADALGTNGANVPEGLRKGGMSVKFVSNSDNKYVQYRLMSDTFNTTPANWQGVDDVPTAGSNNIVKSGGVFDSAYTAPKPISEWEKETYLLNGDNTFAKTSGAECVFVPCAGRKKLTIHTNVVSIYSFIKTKPSGNGAADYATGGARTVIYTNTLQTVNIPSDANFIYVLMLNNNTSFAPDSVCVDNYDFVTAKENNLNVSIDGTLSTIIKEMYIQSLTAEDMADITKVRIYNGFSGIYGIKFYHLTEERLFIPCKNATADVIENGNDYALVDFDNISGTYVDVEKRNVILSGVYDVKSQPTIKEYIESKDFADIVLNEKLTTESFKKSNYLLISGNVWNFISTCNAILIPCEGKKDYYITTYTNNCVFAFLKSDEQVEGGAADCATGSTRTVVSTKGFSEGAVPADAKYLYIILSNGGTSFTPDRLVVDGYDYIKGEEYKRSTVTNVAPLADIIKELYITTLNQDALDLIIKVQIYKGGANVNNFWGIRLVDASGSVELMAEISTTKPNSPILRSFVEYSSANIAIIDWDAITIPSGSDYIEYTASHILLNSVRDIDSQPQIKALIAGGTKEYFLHNQISPEIKANDGIPMIYNADNKVNSNHIVNAVMYPNGVIIGARYGGSIVRIDLDGTETTLLTIQGAQDWRCLWMDSNLNVYASPHGSFGGMGTTNTDRGLYKLAYGSSSFVKVISLYDTASSDTYETQENDDTIWTMCEDAAGYLYAGVYSHTKRPAPRIYRSTDGGNTWVDYFDFLTIIPQDQFHPVRHVHTIIYNKYDDSLYCVIGELNTIFRSTDQAITFVDLNIQMDFDKCSSMLAVPDGLLLGSDEAYDCLIAKVDAENKFARTIGHIWANTVFAIRESDVTGWLYAFTKIDSAVNNTDYYPPIYYLEHPDEIISSWNGSFKKRWIQAFRRMQKLYPDDAIRPQHCSILVSKDGGNTWQVLKKWFTGSYGASGFITIGYFRNGECLAGQFVIGSDSGLTVNTIAISEGKHNYTADGIDLNGDILIRTNSSTVIS